MKKKGRDSVLSEIMKGSLLRPSPDFTSRVMNMVKKEKAPVLKAYEPLISLKGWIIIGSAVLVLLTSCVMVVLNGNYTSVQYGDFLRPLFERIGTIDIVLDFRVVFIGIMVAASVTILLFADFIFNTAINPETGFEE